MPTQDKTMATKAKPVWDVTVLHGRTFITESFNNGEGRMQIAEVTGIKGRTHKNATLIASAPALAAENAALREALKAIVDQSWLNAEHDGIVMHPDLIEQARASLAQP